MQNNWKDILKLLPTTRHIGGLAMKIIISIVVALTTLH